MIFSVWELTIALRQFILTSPDWPADATQAWEHMLGLKRTWRGGATDGEVSGGEQTCKAALALRNPSWTNVK